MALLTPEQWAALSDDERRRIMAQTAYERTQQAQEDKKPPSTGQSTLLALAPAAGYLGVRGIASGIGALSGGEVGAAGASAAGSGAAGAGTTGASYDLAASGVGNLFGSGAAGTEAAATGSSAAGSGTGFLSSAGAALPWLGVAGLGAATGMAGYNAYRNAENKGVEGGIKEGIRAAGPLNFVPVLGQLPWLAGGIRGALGGKKHKDQYARDYGRRNLKDAGLINDKYELELMDGQTFNIGKEDPWSDAEKSPYGGKRQYDLDVTKLDDPAISAALQPVIGGANAIATLAGNDQMAGYLVNAATRTKDPYAQTRAWIDKLGGREATIATLGQMNLPKEQIIAAQTGVNMIYDAPKWTAPMPGAKSTQSPEARKPEQKAATGRIAKLFAAAGK